MAAKGRSWLFWDCFKVTKPTADKTTPAEKLAVAEKHIGGR
jgi:hypothetical protein